MQVIYVDVLFLMNLSADFLILSLSARLLGRQTSRLRLCLASLLGAVFGVLAEIFLAGTAKLLLSAAVLGLMVRIALGFGSRARFLRAALTVFLLSGLLGGVISLVWRLLGDFFGTHEVAADTGGKLIAFLLLSCFGYLLVRLTARLAGVGRESTVRATVRIGQAKRGLELLVDSGCFLREPLSGKAVIILSRQGAAGLLPASLLSAEEGRLPALSGEERRRYYAIPYHTVAGRRMMHGYRPDRIELVLSGKRRSVSALIGLGTGDRESFRGCDGLVPSGILES